MLQRASYQRPAVVVGRSDRRDFAVVSYRRGLRSVIERGLSCVDAMSKGQALSVKDKVTNFFVEDMTGLAPSLHV